MREVEHDKHWEEEPNTPEQWEKYQELLAKYNALIEESRGGMNEQLQGLSDYADRQEALEGVLVTTGPSEAELVIIALLMRLYDVNSALLAHFNHHRANEVYDKHAEGGHYNPEIFIPDMRQIESEPEDVLPE